MLKSTDLCHATKQTSILLIHSDIHISRVFLPFAAFLNIEADNIREHKVGFSFFSMNNPPLPGLFLPFLPQIRQWTAGVASVWNTAKLKTALI